MIVVQSSKSRKAAAAKSTSPPPSFENIGRRLLDQAIAHVEEQETLLQNRQVDSHPRKKAKTKGSRSQARSLDEFEVAAPHFNMWAFAAFLAARSPFEVEFCDTSVLSKLSELTTNISAAASSVPASSDPASDLQLCGPIAALFAAILAATPALQRDPVLIAHAFVAKAQREVAKAEGQQGEPSLSAPGTFAWYASLGAWRVWPAVLISACTLPAATSEVVADAEQLRVDRTWRALAESLSAVTPKVEGLPRITVVPLIFSIAEVQQNNGAKVTDFNVSTKHKRYAASGGAAAREFKVGLNIALIQYTVGRGSSSSSSRHDHCAVFFKVKQAGRGGPRTPDVCVVWEPLADTSGRAKKVIEELAPPGATLMQFVGDQEAGETVCVQLSIATIIRLVQWISDPSNESLAGLAGKNMNVIAESFFEGIGKRLSRVSRRTS